MLESRANSGERRRVNRDYLVGSLFCGMCYEEEIDKAHRLIIQRSVGNGGEYLYWFCRGRQLKICKADYKQYERVEQAIIDHYATVRFTPDFVAKMRQELHNTIADSERHSDALARQVKQQLAKLATQEENLLDLAADGTIPRSGCAPSSRR